MAETQEKLTLHWIDLIFNKHQKNIQQLRLDPIVTRKSRLQALRLWIHANRTVIHAAMYADFKKPAAEVDGTELFHVLSEIKLACDNITNWTEPTKVDAPVTMLGTRSFIQYEPYGVCLIIAPWNYPFSLCIGPLVSALAAGNSVIIKPSELTPNVSAIIKKLAEDVFQNEIVSVCEGGPDVSQYLIKLPFDHIFFTGSPSIGKIVMKAAAENLTAVTLELGGKSPAIITSSAIIKDAAQRIAVGKFINNGQTCIAPDYILVDENVASAFTQELIHQTKKMFTENDEPFEASNHYARIVSEKHLIRLNDLLNDAMTKGAKLDFSGEVNLNKRFFHPTILSQVSSDSLVLEEEIFGPILPIITYKTIAEAIDFINNKPKPLALYVFTTENKIQNKVLNETSSGAVCINDCAIHFLNHNLPFGGVSNSGMGKSHGYAGFLTFSHAKSVLRQRNGFTSVQAFYPPYTSFKQKLMNWFLKLF